MSAELPPDLSQALDATLRAYGSMGSVSDTRALSRRYRASDGSRAVDFTPTQGDVLSYLRYRFPATYAAARATFTGVAVRRPDWFPVTLLDVGAGPGTSSWAALDAWPSIREAVCIERDNKMIRIGKELARRSEQGALRYAAWTAGDLRSVGHERTHDLVVASYMLGELVGADLNQVIDRLWAWTRDTLVIIEPGTPRNFTLVREARDRVRSGGGHTVAPCPHNDACPLGDDDWCHFSQRLSRSKGHRLAKGAERAFEDEKFSYAVMSRVQTVPASSRIIRHPQTRPGHIMLTLSTPNGIRHTTVSRRDGALFRLARHAQWGDEWSDPTQPPGGQGAP